LPRKEKEGKEVGIYLGNEELQFIDKLVDQGKFRSRSAAISACIREVMKKGKIEIRW